MIFGEQYLTYEEYKALEGQPISETPFNLLEYKSRKEINKYTFNRIETITNEIKLCTMELINLFYSVNNGVESSGNAINYGEKDLQLHIKKIIYSYLSNSTDEDEIPLLYCGVE